ncbi:MAG: hypothetical protein U1E05_17455, partial [Patescibacteria group bacterium]|nr:hypothetical protein [Patescibacteria group bacterium]
YGAVACFLISLPLTGLLGGRLPSIYIMGAGGILSVVGFAMRDLRIDARSGSAPKGVSSGFGILILVAIAIGMFVWIARL